MDDKNQLPFKIYQRHKLNLLD